jgi:hypothetical protein
LGRGRCPCCANLRLSRALLFEHGHGTGCREQALKVLSSDFNVYNIRATTITRWHNTHANLDPTNSSTQFELRGDAPFKVCTRVLLHSVPLPLFPDPCIPAAAGRRCSFGKQEGQLMLLVWRPTADLCVIFYIAPTAITDREIPCEKAASSRGVPPEDRSTVSLLEAKLRLLDGPRGHENCVPGPCEHGHGMTTHRPLRHLLCKGWCHTNILNGAPSKSRF